MPAGYCTCRHYAVSGQLKLSICLAPEPVEIVLVNAEGYLIREYDFHAQIAERNEELERLTTELQEANDQVKWPKVWGNTSHPYHVKQAIATSLGDKISRGYRSSSPRGHIEVSKNDQNIHSNTYFAHKHYLCHQSASRRDLALLSSTRGKSMRFPTIDWTKRTTG